MPQSLSLAIIHVIFSTKDRAPLLAPALRPDLFAYLATVARNDGGWCFRAGGVADHVHLAVRLPRTVSIATLVSQLKTSSTRWLKDQGGVAGFAWQRGYASFSVGPRDLDALVQYIDAQQEHHHKRSFQDEYRSFLKTYGVEFDERYVWD